MKRLLLWLIIVTFILGFASAFVPFLVPSVTSALDPLICPGDETVQVNQQNAQRGGVLLTFRCVNSDGIATDAGILPYIVLFSAWCWMPLIPAILLIFLLRTKSVVFESDSPIQGNLK
jgi:MFS family permease